MRIPIVRALDERKESRHPESSTHDHQTGEEPDLCNPILRHVIYLHNAVWLSAPFNNAVVIHGWDLEVAREWMRCNIVSYANPFVQSGTNKTHHVDKNKDADQPGARTLSKICF